MAALDGLEDAAIERTLQQTIKALYQADQYDQLTYRRVRNSTEEQLKLPLDALKEDSRWREKSKAVIKAAIVRESPLFHARPPSFPIYQGHSERLTQMRT